MNARDDYELLGRYERYLAPISIDQPAGVDLQRATDPLWIHLKEARLGESAGFIAPQAAPEKEPDWDKVIELSQLALEKKSKDVRIAVWLLEAFTRKSGFDGIRDGLFVVRELIERFVDAGLLPILDDEEADVDEAEDYRLYALRWLDRELPGIAAEIPLSPASEGEVLRYRDYQAAIAPPARDSWLFAEPVADPAAVRQAMEAAARSVSKAHFQSRAAAVGSALHELDQLERMVARRGSELRFPKLAEMLRGCHELLTRWTELAADIPDRPRRRPPPPPPPETIADPWAQALAYVRLGQVSKAVPSLAEILTTQPSERDRFLKKTELAQTLLQAGRHEAAAGILTELAAQIDEFQLDRWESPQIVGRVWAMMRECQAIDPSLMKRLYRLAPWVALADGNTGPYFS